MYEAGYSGFVLHRELVKEGIDNIVVNPASIAVSKSDRVKTDKRDSRKLAEHLSAGLLRGAYVPTPEEEERRLLTRTRRQLVQAKVRLKLQIRMKLHQFGKIDMNDNRLIGFKMVKEILDNGNLPPKLQGTIERLYIVWRVVHKQIRGIEVELAREAQEDKNETTYRSVPGVGPLSARVLSHELGDMSRFRNERALFSYLGLTPSEHSSGESKRSGSITKQGQAQVRQVLVESAWFAIRQDEGLAQDFARLAARAGKRRAIVAIARRLAGRMRAIFRKQEVYRISLGTNATPTLAA